MPSLIIFAASGALIAGLLLWLVVSRARARAIADRAIRELHKSELQIEDLQRMAHLGNWEYTFVGGRLELSAEACRMLGADPADGMPGYRRCLRRIYKGDRAAFFDLMRAAIAYAQSGMIDLRVDQGDGASGWVHVVVLPWVDENAQVQFVRGTLHDITDRKQAEEAMRGSEERLFGIINVANETIIAVDQDFNVVLFNPAAEKMFGCAAAEAIGASIDRFIPVNLREGHRHHMTRFAAHEDSSRRMGEAIQVTALRGDGAEFPAEASIAKLTQNGRPLYSVILTDVSVRRRDEERLRFLANYDALTTLPNRAFFNERLTSALAMARRSGKGLAVMFIDLDRFKNINDTLGHEAGDCVLREVANRLTGIVRESDTVARLGGDEFVVLVEQLSDNPSLGGLAQKLIKAVAAPIVLDGREYHLTASVGISAYPADGSDGATLLKNADVAMYRAKEQGKNNFQFYAAQMNANALERLTLESALRRALEREEFLLHYQPKVDFRSGRVTGMEALVRWERPGKGMVPPAQFIPLAEETGLIVPLGEWVLLTACASNRAWQREGMPPLRVAVNLSARQFAHASLVRDVAHILLVTGLDPASLELEITESMVMGNPQQAVQTLHQIKSMGVALALDDFGTGYSSLAYLRRFPLDHIKIDRSFIHDIPGNADAVAIIDAILAMSHSLRLKVVAEGVENIAQFEFLRDRGCDEMQGFYFSRPLPASEFRALVYAQDERAALTA